MEKKKKQKRPENHSIFIQNKIFFGRHYPQSEIAQKESATIKKMRNILALYDELKRYGGYDRLDIENFCKNAETSRSNFRRILAIVKKYLKIDDGTGNTVANGCIKFVDEALTNGFVEDYEKYVDSEEGRTEARLFYVQVYDNYIVTRK